MSTDEQRNKDYVWLIEQLTALKNKRDLTQIRQAVQMMNNNPANNPIKVVDEFTLLHSRTLPLNLQLKVWEELAIEHKNLITDSPILERLENFKQWLNDSGRSSYKYDPVLKAIPVICYQHDGGPAETLNLSLMLYRWRHRHGTFGHIIWENDTHKLHLIEKYQKIPIKPGFYIALLDCGYSHNFAKNGYVEIGQDLQNGNSYPVNAEWIQFLTIHSHQAEFFMKDLSFRPSFPAWLACADSTGSIKDYQENGNKKILALVRLDSYYYQLMLVDEDEFYPPNIPSNRLWEIRLRGFSTMFTPVTVTVAFFRD